MFKTIDEYDPAKEIPNLSGKVIVITGGTSGCGKTTILNLVAHSPSQIIFTGRSTARAQSVISEANAITPETTTKVSFVESDFTDLESVRKAGEEILSNSGGKIDVLICNAGVAMPPVPGVTKQGYEQAFGINYLAHAALIQVLLPNLRHTASLPASDVRIILLSTEAIAVSMAPSPTGILFPLLKTPMPASSFSNIMPAMKRYAQSKLALTLFGFELAKRYPEITTISVSPGKVKTEMADNSPWWARLIMFLAPDALTAEQGSFNTLWAATVDKHLVDEESQGELQGGWVYPVGKKGPKIPYRSEALELELWEWTRVELKANGFGGIE